MGWTKRQFVEEAFSEIGLASYVYDLTPDQLQRAVRRLDAMMAKWNADGVRVGWPMPSTPDSSDIDTDTNVLDAANEAIYLNLGVRIGPMFGKVLSPQTLRSASEAYTALVGQVIEPIPQLQLPLGMPRGAGSKPWRNSSSGVFVTPPVDPLEAGPDSAIDFT